MDKNANPVVLQMFESTEWELVEPSNEDTNKYDNICPTIVTWKALPTSKQQVDVTAQIQDEFIENTKVIEFFFNFFSFRAKKKQF